MSAADKIVGPRRRSKGRPTARDGVGKQALIDAARDLLRTRHPKEITAQEIARAAGGDPRLVTYYFGGRAPLMEAVAAQTILEFRAGVPAFDPGLSAAEQLRDRVGAYLAFARENPHLFRMVADHLMPSDEPATAKVRRDTLAGSMGEFIEIVDEGVSADELWAMDPHLLLVAVMAMSQFPYTNPALFQAVVGEPVSEAALDRYQDFMVRLILGGRELDGGDQESDS